MKRNWVPILICLSLLAVPAVLGAEPAAPATAPSVAAPAVAAPQGCGPQAGALAALTAAPVCPAAPAVVVNPMAGAISLAWVCCTPEDKAACRAECAPCSAFTHCFATECLCDCLC